MKRMKQLLQAATSQRTLQAATGLRTLQASIGQRTALIPALLLCLLAMAGCSQDEPTNGQPDNDNATGQKITVTASMPDGGADTRLSYEDQTNGQGTGKLVVKWKDSDENIYLYNMNEGTSSHLTQKSNSLSDGGKKTDFIGNLPANTAQGDVLYAYYKSDITGAYNFNSPAYHNITSIRSDGAIDNMKHAMYAKTTYQGGETVNFSFQFLTAALKLTLEGIPDGVTINSLQLNGIDVVETANVNLTAAAPTYWTNTSMNKVENLLLTTSKNTFYTALIPASLTGGMDIVATGNNGKIYEINHLPATTIEAGNIYVVKASLTEITATAIKSAAALQAVLDAAAAGTKDIPTVIELANDIDVMGLFSEGYTEPTFIIGDNKAQKHIKIDGKGQSLIAKTDNIQMFLVNEGSSITFTNITIDGNSQMSGKNCIEASEDATVTLDNNTVVKDIKNLVVLYMTEYAKAVVLNYASLIIKPGATISGIEGYAIAAGGDKAAIKFEGGTLSDNGIDVALGSINKTTPVIDIETWPTVNEGSGKFSLRVDYQTTTNEGYLAKSSSSSYTLKADDFTLKEAYYNNNKDTNSEIYVDSNILKIRQKPKP